MWRNIVAEHDSIYLSQYLRKKAARYTSQFMSFEKIWALDEVNHYLGLRKIYCCIYNLDEAKIHTKVASREPDFSEIEDLLAEEFSLCVCFAYDELVPREADP